MILVYVESLRSALVDFDFDFDYDMIPLFDY